MNPSRRDRSIGDGRPAHSPECVLVDSTLGESQTVTSPQLYSDQGKTEIMSDVVGNIGCNFNPCEHRKLVMNSKPITSGVVDSFGVPKFSFTYLESGLTVPSIMPVLEELCVPDAQWLDAFSASAEHHFITLVKEDMSLANMLIELMTFCKGNIRKLLALAEKYKACFAKYLQLLKKYPPEKAWLAWWFAMKPFFNDSISFFKSLRKAAKRLKWLMRRSGLDTFIQYREDGYEEELPTFGWPIPSTNLPWLRGGGIYPVDAHVKFVGVKRKFQPAALGLINFNADHLHDDFAWLCQVWFQSVGLFNPVKIGWEAFPFSWLIDWFVNKRTQLQLEAGSLALGFNNATLKQCSHSIKCTIEGKLVVVIGSDGTEYEYGDFHYVSYVRQPDLPKPDVPPFKVDLNWWNHSILSALFAQHHRRGR